ncbi:MAG: hypothetical protein WCL13_03775, partial [bacterium]
MKKLWRKNFEIKQAEYIMMSGASESFFKFQMPTVDKSYLQKSIMVFENGDNIASYFLKDELDNYVRNILKEVIKNPGRVKKIQDRNTSYNQEYFNKLKEVEKIKYKELSDKQLVDIFYQLFYLMKKSHGYALATTWFVDSNGEDLSNYLINLLRKKIEQNKLLLNIPEVFSVLTTPDKESMARREEKEMLIILELIRIDKV